MRPDAPPALKKFQTADKLPFPLLSDPDKSRCQALGAMKNKLLYGRSFLGVDRSIFLLDGQGRLAQAWRGVKATGNGEKVLAALRQITT